MKKKAEKADVVVKGIRKLELIVVSNVKRYHSDNANEQRTENLVAALKSNETHVTSTAAYSSEQNEFEERRFGKIFNATRAVLAEIGLPKKF